MNFQVDLKTTKPDTTALDAGPAEAHAATIGKNSAEIMGLVQKCPGVHDKGPVLHRMRDCAA